MPIDHSDLPALDFIIIGAQKSASTFVHRCLREHPRIVSPFQEVPLFSSPHFNNDNVSRLISELAHESLEKREPFIYGIKRPDYLGQDEVPANISACYPRVKLICVLRNPVDRLISAYYHYMRCGFIPMAPLEQGMEGILSGEYSKKYRRGWQLLEYGFYARHLKRYLESFDRSQLYICQHEDIKADAQGRLHEIQNFLGIAQHTPDALNERPMASIYSMARLKWLSVTGRDANQEVAKKSIGFRIMGSAGRSLDHHLLRHICSSKPPCLPGYIYRQILDVYLEDIIKLESLTGFDLGSWKEAIGK